MKALILAAGRGDRLGIKDESRNKCMLKLRGGYVIEYSLASIASMDIEETIIVVGHQAESIINAFGTSYDIGNSGFGGWGMPIRYVFQREQKGLVHAIDCAKDALGGEDFALFLGDEVLINPKHEAMLKKFEEEELFAICGVLVERDRKKICGTYAVLQDEDGKMYRLIEKPRNPPNDIKGTGNCIFRNQILSFIERTPIHPERGERELPDLIQCAIDGGQLVKSFIICDEYANINTDDDLQESLNMTAELR